MRTDRRPISGVEICGGRSINCKHNSLNETSGCSAHLSNALTLTFVWKCNRSK